MAFGLDDAISNVSNLLTTAIDKIWPDPADKAKAEAVAMAATADAVVRQLEATQKVMLAEAQSADPWTSRARPTFLYVVYIMLLSSIPMGIVYAFAPSAAASITAGFRAWLSAIPESITQLFGVVMLGYIGGRSWEKVKGASK